MAHWTGRFAALQLRRGAPRPFSPWLPPPSVANLWQERLAGLPNGAFDAGLEVFCWPYRHLAKVEVDGSIPFIRSTQNGLEPRFRAVLLFLQVPGGS
jgi:hypothetical protein